MGAAGCPSGSPGLPPCSTLRRVRGPLAVHWPHISMPRPGCATLPKTADSQVDTPHSHRGTRLVLDRQWGKTKHQGRPGGHPSEHKDRQVGGWRDMGDRDPRSLVQEGRMGRRCRGGGKSMGEDRPLGWSPGASRSWHSARGPSPRLLGLGLQQRLQLGWPQTWAVGPVAPCAAPVAAEGLARQPAGEGGRSGGGALRHPPLLQKFKPDLGWRAGPSPCGPTRVRWATHSQPLGRGWQVLPVHHSPRLLPGRLASPSTKAGAK